MEGAERTNRETFNWVPPQISPDAQLASGKELADLRTRDSIQNDGYAMGAMSIHKDSIVGSHFRLNSRPNWRVLKSLGFNATPEWAEEFQTIAEDLFDLIAESANCYLDAAGVKTLTEMVRLTVGCWVLAGENLATGEWLKDRGRPLKTAVNVLAPQRLSNPDRMFDTQYLRGGIERNTFGRPLAYHIRTSHPGDWFSGFGGNIDKWMRIPREKPWGRRQVIHGFSSLQPDQSRGISEMVAVLKQMRMTRKYQDMVLQNAVIQASYAATIESELPRDQVAEMMGQDDNSSPGFDEKFLSNLLTYVSNSQNLNIDGAKVPVLYPGTKLNVQALGGPGGIGEGFEESLLRHTASGLGLSYEQFSRDYSKTNYSSARASMSETEKYMASRKKLAADAFATQVWLLVLEELVSLDMVPLPPGMKRSDFYRPMVKEALGRCTWIGAGKGFIDRLKETQAAVMSINAGLSTREEEIARNGGDFRETFEQLSREKALAAEYGLDFSSEATKPGANDRQQSVTESGNDNEENSNADE